MGQATYIRFKGLNAPVLLDGCGELLAPLRQIIPAWPFETSGEPGPADPVVVVSRAGRGRYGCVSLSSCGAVRRYDAVDAICDMIVELSWELLRSSQRLMCLHGAAVEIAGRLIIVPNMRRAGKSTLTACLAHRGARVYSDDFFPVGLCRNGHFRGVAMGISPRLRLPVPDGFSAGFRDWVAANNGPANRRYKYLTLPGQPAHGAECPLGAIVILDRHAQGPASIAPMDLHDAARVLMRQNFARSVHSGTILQMVTSLLQGVEPHRLSYSSAEDAAALLEATFAEWPATLPRVGLEDSFTFREVDEALLDGARPVFEAHAAHVRKDGFCAVEMNGGIYLTDAFGLGVHRLNDGSLAIWRLLEEPMRLDEVCDVLAEAFPDVPRALIEKDSTRMLREFVQHRLVEPVDKA